VDHDREVAAMLGISESMVRRWICGCTPRRGEAVFRSAKIISEIARSLAI
jgi:predicted transcriptional regulator